MPRVRLEFGCTAAQATVDSAWLRGHNPAVKSTRWWMLPVLLAVLVGGGWYFGFRAKGEDRELPVYVTGGQRMAEGACQHRKTERGERSAPENDIDWRQNDELA